MFLSRNCDVSVYLYILIILLELVKWVVSLCVNFFEKCTCNNLKKTCFPYCFSARLRLFECRRVRAAHGEPSAEETLHEAVLLCLLSNYTAQVGRVCVRVCVRACVCVCVCVRACMRVSGLLRLCKCEEDLERLCVLL